MVFAAVYRVMLLMSEVSKAHTGPAIQSNVSHVGGVKSGVCSCIQSNVTDVRAVERDSKYTIRAHDIFAYNFLNIQLIFNPTCFNIDSI